MNREILFRGKNKITGKWDYGFLLISKEGLYSILMPDSGQASEVNPETVGQYTGLTDKNGNKIFEGDILKGFDYPYLYNDNFNYFAKVMWFDNCPAFGIYTFKSPESKVIGNSEGITEFMEEWCSSQWEVIGNIHNNPELLKKRRVK